MTILDEIRMRPYFFLALLTYLITALAFFILVALGKVTLIGSPAVPLLGVLGFLLVMKLKPK
jgi:hypothetical protein